MSVLPEGHTENDDHHSPLDPEDYIRWRLKPMSDFYQKRIPKYNRQNVAIESILLAGAVISAVISAFEYAQWCALVSALLALFMSWRSFHQADKKLVRYANTLEKINVINSWWESLDSIEKSNADNIQQLVDNSEEILSSEWEAWSSAATKTKKMDGSENSADQDGSENIEQEQDKQNLLARTAKSSSKS